MEIDPDAAEALRGLPQVVISAQAHALEHSLEVHVPFLQTVLEKFTLVPLGGRPLRHCKKSPKCWTRCGAAPRR